MNLGAQRAAHGERRAHGFRPARLVVRPAARDDGARGALEVLELAPPVLGLAPAGQGAATAAPLFNPGHACAAGVPEPVQVGRERHVGFQDATVHLELKRRSGRAVVFLRTPFVRRRPGAADLLQQFVIAPGDVVAPRLLAEPFFIRARRRGGHAQPLRQERIAVGDVFPAIPGGVQAQAPDAQHEDLPAVPAGAAGGFLARENFDCEPGAELGREGGMPPAPLEAGAEGRPFIAAGERPVNLFDGRELEIRLGLEAVAQGGECCRFRHRHLRKHSNPPPTFAPPHPHRTQCRRARWR